VCAERWQHAALAVPYLTPESMITFDRNTHLIIKDAAIKADCRGLLQTRLGRAGRATVSAGEPAPGMSRERFLRLLDAAEYLAAHIHEAPVWIVPCLEGGTPTRTSGSSIYPAAQNMLLVARALGLGATFTTLYLQVREGSGSGSGLAARRPFLCSAADRLPNGTVRAGSSYRARRCRLSRPVGSDLP
jgi:hypothetical protein